MADHISLRPDLSKWEAALLALENQAPKAIMRAINRTATNAKAAMVPVVAADMGVKQKDVRERITISTAREDKLTARLDATTKRLDLIDFKAKGPEPSRGRGKGVTAKLVGGAGRYPNAFIARMKNGHRGVFQRSGTKRLGIYELRGPSIAQAFDSNSAVAQERSNEMLSKNVQHEIEFLLQQAKQ